MRIGGMCERVKLRLRSTYQPGKPWATDVFDYRKGPKSVSYTVQGAKELCRALESWMQPNAPIVHQHCLLRPASKIILGPFDIVIFGMSCEQDKRSRQRDLGPDDLQGLFLGFFYDYPIGDPRGSGSSQLAIPKSSYSKLSASIAAFYSFLDEHEEELASIGVESTVSPLESPWGPPNSRS